MSDGAAGEASAPADTAPVLDAYYAGRLLNVAEPLRPRERALAAHATAALQRFLGLDPRVAADCARRAMLERRTRLFHDLLLLRGDPAVLAALLDRTAVEGEATLIDTQGRGVLFVTLHYGLYTSLLWEWLGRETARGRFRHFTSLMIASAAGGPDWVARRTTELAAVGLVKPGTFTVLDRKAGGERGVARAMAAALRDGGVVLVAPDVGFLPPDDPRALAVQLGRERIGLPRGAAWLTETTRCLVVPIFVRTVSQDYAIMIGTPRASDDRQTARAAVQAVIQELFDAAVLPAPASWEEWSRVEWATPDLPETQALPTPAAGVP